MDNRNYCTNCRGFNCQYRSTDFMCNAPLSTTTNSLRPLSEARGECEMTVEWNDDLSCYDYTCSKCKSVRCSDLDTDKGVFCQDCGARIKRGEYANKT